MLVELMNELVSMYQCRAYSDIVYCGYGTTIDSILMESGVSISLFKKMDDLAYCRVMNNNQP